MGFNQVDLAFMSNSLFKSRIGFCYLLTLFHVLNVSRKLNLDSMTTRSWCLVLYLMLVLWCSDVVEVV